MRFDVDLLLFLCLLIWRVALAYRTIDGRLRDLKVAIGLGFRWLSQ